MYIKTENHYSKGKRTQIIHTQVDTQEMQGFPPFKYDNEGKLVPNTWEKPIIKKRVIHHNI